MKDEKRAEELRKRNASWKRWARTAKVISMVSLEPKGPYRERYLVALKPDRRFAFFKDASTTKKEKPQ
jgi:hypothetical protein